MVRLPDIGFSEWIADQQAEFQKKTAGYFDALEFRDAASQLEELIPHDFPTIGGEDTWAEEQKRIQEAEQRRQEQEAAIREAQMDAAQAAWMQQQQEAETARQRDLMMQAHKEASSYGIPTPNDVFNEFSGLEGRPLGTGHPDTSSGVFDAADQAPAPAVPSLESIAPDQAFSEFSSISPKERLLEGVDPSIGRYDFGAAASSLASIPGQISDVASTFPGQVSSAASTIWDAIPSGEQIMEMDRSIREYPIRKPIQMAENVRNSSASALWEGSIKPLVNSASAEVDKLSPLYERAKATAAEASRVRAEAGLPPIIDLDPTHLPIQESARTPAVRAADLAAVQAANDLVGAGLTAPLNVLADAADRESGFSPIVAPLRREAEKFAPTWKKAADASYELEQARAEAGMGAVPALNIFPDRDADRHTEKTRAAEARAMQASREMLSQGGHGALKGLADATDAALANIGWDRESREVSGGLGEQFGFGKIGVADLIVNLAPTKALNAVQWADVGASLIDAPTATGTTLGFLGALMAGAKYLPKQTITLIGGLAAGIESVYSQRDIDFSGDYTLRDTLLQSLGGTAAGATVATGTKPAIGAINRTVANTIRAIAASPTLEEALTRLDIAGGRALDLAGQGGNQAIDIARKYPAVATALGITAGAAAGDAIGDYMGGDTEATATPSMGAGAVVGGVAAAGGKAGAVDAAVQAGRKFAPAFYSKLEQVVKSPKLAARVTPEDLDRFIQNNQVKPDELKWTGMDDWIAEKKAQGGFITRDDLNKFIDENKIEVRDIELERLDEFHNIGEEFDPYILRPAPNSNGTSFTAGDDWQSTSIHLTTGPDELPRWEARVQTYVGEDGVGRDLNINSRNQDVRLGTLDEAVEWINQQRASLYMEPVTIGDRTIYGDYLEPGGKKYRELLLVLPNIPKPRGVPASSEPAQKVWYLLDVNDDIAETFHSREAAWTEYQSLSPQEKDLYRVEEDVLGTKPPPEKYGSGHWPGYDNVLAHIRFDERVDPRTGKKILMIDEIQSDWHQEGRTRGYAPRTAVSPERLHELGAEKDRIFQASSQRGEGLSVAEARRLSQIEMELDPSGIPEAPFQNNWQALALKRMMRYAAENGYDRIEWWSGDPHVERWGTPEFKWVTEPNGFRISAVEHVPVGGGPGRPSRTKSIVVANEDELNDYIERIFSEEAQPGRREFAEGKDVISKLWGQMQAKPEGVYRPREEGLHYFYDKALPAEMGKLAKKFDAKVTQGTQVNPRMEDVFNDDVYERNARPSATETIARTTYGIDVTPSMKETVLYEGQSQFIGLPPGLVEGGAGAAAGSQSEEDSGFSAGGALVGAALGVNVAKLPKNGPWQERLARGLEVPEGATPRIKNMLNRAYGEAMRLLEKSQTVSGASRKIRFHTMANEAYQAYENLLSSGSPEGAARVSEAPRPLRGSPPERVPPAPQPRPAPEAPRAPDEEAAAAAAADMAEDAYPFGQGEGVPAAASTVPASVAPEPRPGIADEFTVEPEPLPDRLDPQTVIDQTQFKAIVARLQEDMAMNPAHVQALNDAVVKIMMAPGDIKGRHVDKLVRWAGNLRSLPRGVTKEEAIEQYAQTQLRKAGLISDGLAAPEMAAPQGWGTVDVGPGRAERFAMNQVEFGDRVPLSALASGGAGFGTGLTVGGPDQPLNERLQTAVAGGVVGTAAGAAVAKRGSVAAGRFIDRLIGRGFLNEEILRTHPHISDRAAAMLALAARDLPDDAPIVRPAAMDYLIKAHDYQEIDFPDALADLAVRRSPDEPITAGEVRAAVSDPSMLERMGKALSEYLTDVVTGNAGRATRAKETAADAMTVRKWNSIPRIKMPTGTLGSEYDAGDLGRAFRVAPANPDSSPEALRLHQVLQETADELGIPAPELYFASSDRPNMAIQKRLDGTATGMLVTRGVLKRLDDFTDDELRGVVTHELAHTVQPHILGLGMLGRARTIFPERDLSNPPAANAAVGAGLGAMAEDEDDGGYSWEAIAGGGLAGGILKKKLNPNLVKKFAAIEDDLTRSFRSPNQGVSLKGQKFSERAYDFWQNANVKLFDDLGRLQGYQNDLAREFLKQTGMRLPAEMLFAEMKRFDFSNRAKIDVTEYITHGAVKTLNDAGVPQENFDRYLMARQNVDILRAQQGDPKPPGPDSKKPYVGDLTRQFPGNSNYEEEVKLLQKYETIFKEEGTWDAVQSAADDIWSLSGRMLDLLEGGGLIDKTLADTLRTKYPHYIPTRILEKLGDNSFTPPSKSMSINSNQIRELTHEGTSKDALNPTAAMTAAIYQVHAAVQKNKVANAFVDAWDTASGRVNTFDDSGIGQYAPDLTTDVGRRIQRHVDGIQPWPVNDAVPTGWSPLTNFRNGVKEKFIVSDELAPLVNFAKPEHIKVISEAMNFFRQAVTTRNPVFLASNMFLDLSSFLIRESSRAGGPQHMPEVFKEWFKSMTEFVASPAAWADIAEQRYSGDMARALMQGGGMSGGYYPGGVQPAKKLGVIDWIDGKPEDIDAVLKKYNIRDPRSPIVKEVENMRRGMIEINTAGGVARMMKDMLTFKPVEAIGERIEAAPRVAAMRLSEKRVDKTLQLLNQERAETTEAIAGLPTGSGSGIGQKLKDLGLRSLDSIDAEIKDTEARRVIEGTQAYRTTTIDFNKGGEFSRFVNQIVPFFNVGMQSIADVPRAFAENKVGYPATVIAGVTVPVMLAEQWNNMDPQRAKDYADIPTHIKDQGLVVMLPGEAPVDEKGNRIPQYYHFRYRQLAPIAALTREMLQRTWFREQLPAENEQRSLPEMLGSAASMVSPVPVDDPAEFAVGLVPPVLGTGIQATMDRDLFRGKRITSEFADDRASPLSKAAWEAMDKPKGMRPSMIEFISRDAAGGYANFWHGVANMLDGRKTPGVAGVPVVGPFAGRFIKGGGGGKSQIAREHLLTPSAEELLKKHNVSWSPSPVDYKIGDVPLTLSEYGDYQRAVNIAVDKAIQETARKADFLVKSPGEKTEMIERSVGFAKDAVRIKFLSQIPTAERAKRRKLEDEKEKKGWTGVWSSPTSSTPSSSGTTTTAPRSAPSRSGPILPATRP